MLAPVAISTCFALTVPRGVTTSRLPPGAGVSLVTGAFSKSRAPCRFAASASPLPKRPIWSCALFLWTTPP